MPGQSVSVTRAAHLTLTGGAGNADTITFAAEGQEYEITVVGTGDVYARFDGTAPTIAGNETTLIRSKESVVRYLRKGTTTVKLISSSAVEVHVEQLLS